MLQEEEYDSDTSDEDFVPDGVESEDEPVSGAEDELDETENNEEESFANKGKKKKKGKKGRSKMSLFGRKQNDDTIEDEDEKDEEQKTVNEEKSKKKTDDIWADFLADVEDKPSPPPKPKSSSWAALLGNKKNPINSNTVTSKPQDSVKNEVKKKENVEKPSTVKITQVFEFAGEEVRVEKEVDADSAEAKAALASPVSGAANGSKSTTPGSGVPKRPSGMSSIVGFLDSKKQKLTTLEKTKLDWNSFKSQEGLEEELEKHKKSKDGYLDKKAFLERADLRQFEIERALRMNKRSKR